MRRHLIICIVAMSAFAGLPAGAAIGPDVDENAGDLGAATPREKPVEADAPTPRPSPAVTAVPAEPPTSEPAPRSANPLWGIPLKSLTATRDRPIFSASRRPPPIIAPAPIVSAAPPPRPKEIEKPQLSLVGTVIGESESFGLFIDQANKVALRLRVGEQHDGWVLRAVQGREVTLEKDLQAATLLMPQPGKGSDGEIRVAPANPATAAHDRGPKQRLR
jgi:general secretion pathway protein N